MVSRQHIGMCGEWRCGMVSWGQWTYSRVRKQVSNRVVRGGQSDHGVVSEPSCVVDKHAVHKQVYASSCGVPRTHRPPPPPPPPPSFPTHSFLSHRQPMRQYATPVMSFPVHSSGHSGGWVRIFMCLSNITLFHRLFNPLWGVQCRATQCFHQKFV